MAQTFGDNKLKVASLFCGCGGMDLGIQGNFNFLDKHYAELPFEVLYAVDNDAYATKIYNDKMKEILPKRGVTVTEIERISDKGAVPISASRVREAIKNGKKDILEELLPKTTLDYLASQKGIEVIKKIRSKI